MSLTPAASAFWRAGSSSSPWRGTGAGWGGWEVFWCEAGWGEGHPLSWWGGQDWKKEEDNTVMWVYTEGGCTLNVGAQGRAWGWEQA